MNDVSTYHLTSAFGLTVTRQSKTTVRDADAEDRMRYRSVLTTPSVEVVVDKTDAQRRVVAVQRLP